MAADVNLLTTKAECDQALESLTREKATYAHRDYNQTYADGVATDRATTLTAQLAKAADDVTRYTADVARTGLTDVEKRASQRALITATARHATLELNNAAVTGPTAYLADVDADQVDAQIATLATAMQAVMDRKDALPS
jgi:hypothetical protein